MQSHFSLLWPQLLQDHDFNNLILKLDHRASKFELFWLSGLFKRFSKTFPHWCFTIVAPYIFLGDHELNEIDSALNPEALV
jgi:hypothetical protein